DGAPGTLVGLVADTKIEQPDVLAAKPLDDQMEEKLAGACRGGRAFVDGSELADDMVALAREPGDRRDPSLVSSLEPNGVQTQRIGVRFLRQIRERAEKIPCRRIAEDIGKSHGVEPDGFLLEKGFEKQAVFTGRSGDHMIIAAERHQPAFRYA